MHTNEPAPAHATDEARPCFASSVDPEGNPWCSLAAAHDGPCEWGQQTDVVREREQAWDEALRWVRAQADVTSPEYVLDRIDRAEPFNPYRKPRCCSEHDDCHLPGEMVCCDDCPDRDYTPVQE